MCRRRVDWNIPAQSWSWQIITQTNTRQLSLVWWWLHQRCTCLAGHRRRCSGPLLLWNAMWRVFYAKITTTEPSKSVFPSIYNYLSMTQISRETEAYTGLFHEIASYIQHVGVFLFRWDKRWWIWRRSLSWEFLLWPGGWGCCYLRRGRKIPWRRGGQTHWCRNWCRHWPTRWMKHITGQVMGISVRNTKIMTDSTDWPGAQRSGGEMNIVTWK